VSEFDNLKNEAEQYAQQHPDQIREGEQAAEKKFGLGQQGQSGQGGPSPATSSSSRQMAN
jgi:hypothetical protein